MQLITHYNENNNFKFFTSHFDGLSISDLHMQQLMHLMFKTLNIVLIYLLKKPLAKYPGTILMTNHLSQPVTKRMFQRTIKQSLLNEALLDIEKASYLNSKNDKILVKKIRKNETNMPEPLKFKLQGGPVHIAKLDVVKHLLPDAIIRKLKIYIHLNTTLQLNRRKR